MQKLIKITAIMIVAIMIMSFTACSASTSLSLTMDIETGDSIKVKLDTSDGLKMQWDKEKDVMTIEDDDETILSMIFADDEHVKEYLDNAEGYVRVKETGKHSKVKYSLFTSIDDDDENHYIIGWIVGTNTGIIIEGTDSKRETMAAFESMSFSIKTTEQDDDDYYLKSVIMEEVEEDKDGTDSDKETENTKNDETEPDFTEPKDTTTKETEPVKTEPTEPEGTDPIETEPEATEPIKNDNETGKIEGLSDDWKNYEFSIDGKVFKLPISYKELKEATGYSMKSSEEKSYLEPNYYTSVQLRDADDNIVCYIYVLNNTDEDAAYADCLVFKIGQNEFQKESTFAIKFAGNLGVGDVTSKDKLIDLFGEPTDIYEYRSDYDEKYSSDTYTWSMKIGWMSANSIKIEMNINTGIIESIYLERADLEE